MSIRFIINGGQKNAQSHQHTWELQVLSAFERKGHPLQTDESIKLDRWVEATNYVLITLRLISLVKEHKYLEMPGENA